MFLCLILIDLIGKAAIQKSFEKTISAIPSTAKRVFIEDTSMNNNNNILNDNDNNTYYDNNDKKKSVVSSSDDAKNQRLSPVTFCLDFHRPGTAPGLGDKSKCTGTHTN